MTTLNDNYDIAVSFSGAQRAYVEEVVRECRKLDLKVFYDLDEQVKLWGRNVITELRKIYSSVNTRYVVPFLSREYLAGAYPMDEFRAALIRAIDQEDFILPVLMDDVEVPVEYLSPATIYLRSADYSPGRLASAILERITAGGRQVVSALSVENSDVGLVSRAGSLRLPKLAPTRFSAENTMDEALRHIGMRFTAEISALEEYGFRSHVRAFAGEVSVLVESKGRPVCELKVTRGESVWSGALTVAFQWPRVRGGVNGFVRPEWDSEARLAKLRFQDMSMGGVDPLLTAEELFDALWNKIVKFLEQTAR
ncbi:TIR domain-containing protein [Amycolatopsis sp. SB7-3]|uniref:TIR domain-containing protein n=1 Tax=Amycolatopsis sp. SB7-3 TaxID=3373438 RepID=UPI0037420DCE